jgi:ferredoxin
MPITLCSIEFVDTHEKIELPKNSNLTAIEEMGINEIPFSCRAGCCGSCVIEITQGIEHLGTPLPEEKDFLVCLGYPGDAYRLACQCTLGGAIALKKAV